MLASNSVEVLGKDVLPPGVAEHGLCPAGWTAICSWSPFLLQIPPAPTKPDFDSPREKMQKLGEGEGSMTKEEFAKMKQELEA